MATQSLERGNGHTHGQGHGHDHHHDPNTNTYRERLTQAANSNKTPEAIISKPAAACFQQNDLARLLALPTHSYASIKASFNSKNCIKSRSRDWKPPAGLDPLPKPSLTSHTSATTTPGGTVGATTATRVNQPKLDPQFSIGFSMAYGHSIELSMEIESIKEGSPIDSGTYIFHSDEMPYTSVIDKDWQGKLCEECFRRLPTGAEGKTLDCGGCPRSAGVTVPARFCGQACLEQAWRSWHGYECKFSEELDQFEQDTRLALRIFWRNCREGVRMVSGGEHTEFNKNVGSLISTTSGLSLNNNSNNSKVDSANRNPRVQMKDGSQISVQELYHNFDRLLPKAQMALLVKAHYLQELMGLPKGAAQELAQLQALVKFNSFAIKSTMVQVKEGGPVSMSHLEDYTVGSGIYLLASMFNHSCAPNAMVVFGGQTKGSLRGSSGAAHDKGVDPRLLNVLTSKSLKAYGSIPAQVEISYGPQGGRMPTEERRECLRQAYMFECNCSACNDRYAETLRKRVFKCPKNGHGCRPLLEDEDDCSTCGAKVDLNARAKLMELIARLLGDSSDPTLSPPKRLTLLKTLEASQTRLFVDTYFLYGHTCDQLAMVYTQSGDLGEAVQWCRKALKAVMVNFPHDSIEVAQETLKLAGLLFNNMQPKEAMKYVQTAIVLYRGHYGAESKHPDLLELCEMEKVLKPIVTA
ncbi:SET and MYND domain-containing protein 4 [Mortierella sp. AD031]|nr:SET and MYND domain-containing protein 4 [Mortierella sp. AD031]